MGNDGGSIPTRRELVKEAAKNPTAAQLKETLQEKQEYHWTTDPISNKPLIPPIVSDSSGKLYNKETILEYLLPAEDESSKVEAEKILQGAVTSLKDVLEVKFQDEEDSDEQRPASKSSRWVCPITNKALGPGSKAVYLVPCGHAFAGAAVREVAGEKCPQCEEPYAPNDVIPIITTDETEIARLILRAQTLRDQGLTHSLKKLSGSKKRKKNAAKSEAKNDVQATDTTSSGLKNSATASLTAKVIAEQEERNKKRKTDRNENLNSLFSSNKKTSGRNTDFMTRGFSIPARDK